MWDSGFKQCCFGPRDAVCSGIEEGAQAHGCFLDLGGSETVNPQGALTRHRAHWKPICNNLYENLGVSQ